MKIKENIDKDKLFWTSDNHWHHKNIIEFCNRPFEDMQIMDNAMIQNWNKVVPKDGKVFVLGDFIMTSSIEWTKKLISQLNGSIYLIYGNHDYRNRMNRQVIVDLFEGRVMDVAELTIKDPELDNGHINIFMSHYPHMFWPSNYVHLHGHVHSGPLTDASEKVPFHPRRYDVGCDNNDFTPISYHQLKVILTKRSMK